MNVENDQYYTTNSNGIPDITSNEPQYLYSLFNVVILSLISLEKLNF